MSLIGNVLEPLAKIALIPLGLTAAASATDTAIQKKIYGSHFTASLISNEEMKDIMKIDKSLEESGLLIKGVSETIQNATKEQKGGFLSKEAIATSQERGKIRADKETTKSSENF